MNVDKDSDPPDGGGPSENFMYQSSLMDTDDIGVIIKRIPIAEKKNIFTNFMKSGEQLSPHTASPKQDLPNSTSPQSHSPLGTHESSLRSPISSIRLSRYEITDRGPFIVILESNVNNLGSLHPMSVGKLIIKEHKEVDNYIQSIASSEKNRIKVVFISPLHANILLRSPILEEKGIKASIPQYLLKRTGIIRHVDLSLNDEEIQSLLKPVSGQIFTTLEVQRLRRKITAEGKDPEYRPTGSVKITFKGQFLPPQVSLCKVICNVEPFVQKVVQCFNCLRYGHVNVHCKSKVRCNRCGDEHKSSECSSTSPPSCIFCKGNHSASNHKECPEFSKQKSIKTIMANENISYREAMQKQSNSFSAIVQSPIRCTPEDFPSLYDNRKRKKESSIPNTRPLYIANNSSIDPNGNGVALKHTNSSTSVDSGNISSLIEKLVDAVMQLNKNKNLISSECEQVFKNILAPSSVLYNQSKIN